MFYAALCEEYGIDEEAMELYAYNDQILNEENYNEYVKKCKRTGKEPMTQEEYNARKSRIKKGLMAGAAIAATAGAAYGAHKYAQKNGYKGIGDMAQKKKLQREKDAAKARKAGELAAKRADKEAHKKHGFLGLFKSKEDKKIERMQADDRVADIKAKMDAKAKARKYAGEDTDEARTRSKNERAKNDRRSEYAELDRLTAQFTAGKSKDDAKVDKNGKIVEPSSYDKAEAAAKKRWESINNKKLNESFDIHSLFTSDDVTIYDEDFSFDLDDIFE